MLDPGLQSVSADQVGLMKVMLYADQDHQIGAPIFAVQTKSAMFFDLDQRLERKGLDFAKQLGNRISVRFLFITLKELVEKRILTFLDCL